MTSKEFIEKYGDKDIFWDLLDDFLEWRDAEGEYYYIAPDGPYDFKEVPCDPPEILGLVCNKGTFDEYFVPMFNEEDFKLRRLYTKHKDVPCDFPEEYIRIYIEEFGEEGYKDI